VRGGTFARCYNIRSEMRWSPHIEKKLAVGEGGKRKKLVCVMSRLQFATES
jgi:hypothetical protein